MKIFPFVICLLIASNLSAQKISDWGGKYLLLLKNGNELKFSKMKMANDAFVVNTLDKETFTFSPEEILAYYDFYKEETYFLKYIADSLKEEKDNNFYFMEELTKGKVNVYRYSYVGSYGSSYGSNGAILNSNSYNIAYTFFENEDQTQCFFIKGFRDKYDELNQSELMSFFNNLNISLSNSTANNKWDLSQLIIEITNYNLLNYTPKPYNTTSGSIYVYRKSKNESDSKVFISIENFANFEIGKSEYIKIAIPNRLFKVCVSVSEKEECKLINPLNREDRYFEVSNLEKSQEIGLKNVPRKAVDYYYKIFERNNSK